MSAASDFLAALASYQRGPGAPPILPPVPGTPNGPRDFPPPGPGGGPGTPGIAPSGGRTWWDWLNPFAPARRQGEAMGRAAAAGLGPDLSVIGGSVGVYLLLLLLFGLGVWGLIGSGGAVGYVAAPRPFRAPRKPG